MFGLASGFFKALNEKTNVSILIVGLENAGKTTLLERCKVTDFKKQNTSRKEERLRKKEIHMQYSNVHTFSISSDVEESRGGDTISSSSHNDPTSKRMNEDDNEKEGSKDDENELSEIKETDKSVVTDIDIKSGSKMMPLHLIRPTIGMNLWKMNDAFGCKCVVWDLSGAPSMRSLWDRYYVDTDAVVFVVDVTSDENKINEAKEAFHLLKSNEELSGIPVLIFANKLDELDAKSHYLSDVDDLVNLLEVFHPGVENEHHLSIKNGTRHGHHKKEKSKSVIGIIDLEDVDLVRIYGGSAKTGEGVRNAFEWLITTAEEQIQHSLKT